MIVTARTEATARHISARISAYLGAYLGKISQALIDYLDESLGDASAAHTPLRTASAVTGRLQRSLQ